ncbi:hypothetical protein CYMTET_15802 [Cymbomonas tetramitiformis]|uniref:Protein nlrc3 n=1 Tax=Cymbomonas tetramitiformis TaxID=36881 RepID=A0AAE0L8X8_9CHLO|nr:hypothetical protein CYMTET_15802 [Cymbomonas tetramitiformis]
MALCRALCEGQVRGLLAIASALRINSTLTYLNLSRNLIGPAGAAALASGLAHNSRLQVLDLSNNDLVDEGANSDGIQALAEAVARPLPKSMAAIALEVPVSKTYNTSLETLRVRTVELRLGALRRSEIACLDLRNSNVGAEDLHVLAPALALSRGVSTLLLGHNVVCGRAAMHEWEVPGGLGALGVCLAQPTCNITTLDLSHNNIARQGAKALVACMRHFFRLKELNLASNKIGIEGAAAIGAAFAQGRTIRKDVMMGSVRERAPPMALESLILRDNSLSPAAACQITAALTGSTGSAPHPLKLLDLSENMLGGRKQEEAAAGLARMIASNSALESLIMGHNKWTFTEVEIISEAVSAALAEHLAKHQTTDSSQQADQCRSSLRVIQLNEMEIPLYDLHTNVLQELAFPKLCAEDASLIASVLERNTSLDRLTVRGVCMPVGLLTCSGAGPGGVAPLTALHLPRSSLGQEHLILLGHLLMRNSLLTELDLSGNFVAGRERDVELERLEGIEVLANMLKTNTTMHSLDLSTNILGIYGTQRLAAGLAGNRGITKLNLANNNMCGVQTTGYGDWLAEGIKALAGAFAVRKEGDETPYNTTVTSLDLSNNGFGPLGGVEFARVLTPSEEDGRANSSLVHLDLSNNRLAAAGGVALARNQGVRRALPTRQGERCGAPFLGALLGAAGGCS